MVRFISFYDPLVAAASAVDVTRTNSLCAASRTKKKSIPEGLWWAIVTSEFLFRQPYTCTHSLTHSTHIAYYIYISKASFNSITFFYRYWIVPSLYT